ncbi:MAG: hypothetical protein ABIF85_07840 [Nanoarchaeota archaeon]|nr:hypothetical protein [Nanoarchaeota archaeon]MBU4451664.1 hypothetical protein [Nanoarchaeota archaeon]MCG2723398.1 hypothetical protein [archaeon]
MKKQLLFSAIIGMMLFAGFAFANLTIKITPNPVIVMVGTTGNAVVQIIDTDVTGNHDVSIDGYICKDTDGNRNTCESTFINQVNAEMYVTFDNGLLGAVTNSTDEALLNITLSANAPSDVNYLFIVRSKLGWQEAVVTGETTSVPIPEFPSFAVPAVLSMISMGLVRMKYR